jgi:hypothetical protein
VDRSTDHALCPAGAYERKDPELEILASEVVLAARPAAGSAVTLAEFRHQPHLLSTDGRVPDGHVLVKTMWLSVDPFMRCRFNEETGVEYTAPYEVGQPIASAGIGFVQVCGEGVEELAPGNIVMDPFDAWPWRSEAVLDASSLQLVPQSMEALIPVRQRCARISPTCVRATRRAGVFSSFFCTHVCHTSSQRNAPPLNHSGDVALG